MPGNAPAHTDERELLLGYLAQQRDGFRFAAFGLTDDQARLTPSVSALSVGGLIKHVALTEEIWMNHIRGVESDPVDWADGHTLRPDQTLAEVLERLDEVAAATERTVCRTDLDQPVPVPRDAPWYPTDVEFWSARWVLLHILEELTRHVGHADIVRESIDGATMYELMAGAEGWPATDWLTPWSPTPA